MPISLRKFTGIRPPSRFISSFIVMMSTREHVITTPQKPRGVLAAKWKSFKKNGFIKVKPSSQRALTDAEVYHFVQK